MIHGLKIWPEYFNEIVAGNKTFEVRQADHPFAVEDLLAMNEWDPKTETYTGASVLMKVTHLCDDPKYAREGFVIMSTVPCSVTSVCNYVPLATYPREMEGAK